MRVCDLCRSLPCMLLRTVECPSALYASSPEIDPSIWHILSWKVFTSSADSRRASCQLLAKIWALNTRKMPQGGFAQEHCG